MAVCLLSNTLSFNSLLEMPPIARHCVAQHNQGGFNSLLEMHNLVHIGAPQRRCQVVFQFSIGDAAAPIDVPDGAWYIVEKFQFSIGDAHIRLRHPP